MKNFKFYADAGHGWLAVKREFLIELGILDKISNFSYQKGKTVYLEEDCDMTVFQKEMKRQDIDYGIIDTLRWPDHSYIRNYEMFSV